MGITGYFMRMFKWSPDFDPNEETSLAPIWVLLPELHFHVFKWDYLRQVLEKIRTPMKEDIATIMKTRQHMAKVRIEVDLMKPLPDTMFVGIEGDVVGLKGRDQKLEYEGVPVFCRTCKTQGHDVARCKVEGRNREQATSLKNIENEENKQIQGRNQSSRVNENTKVMVNQKQSENQPDYGFMEVKSKRSRKKKANQPVSNAAKGNYQQHTNNKKEQLQEQEASTSKQKENHQTEELVERAKTETQKENTTSPRLDENDTTKELERNASI
ncbi:uncharacterized protein [Nicotiana tomentosiformis]|uniref:uncharacterized protein n=1 Tax=Nicotiana tomentosiformis TaxID=4098 RepID=UPI00388CA111